MLARSLIGPRLVALLVAGCAAFAAFAPGDAAALQFVGAGVHPQGTDDNASLIEQEFSMLQQAGANSVRIDVAWHSVEWTAKGDEDPNTLAWLDYVFQQADAHNLKVDLEIWSTPCWASSAPDSLLQGCSWGWWNRGVMTYPPVNPQDYADFAAFVAQRWGSSLAALELWNEPNGGQFFTAPDPAAAYAQLVRAAYPAVKAVAPNLPVLMSLGGTDTGFLSQLYQDGVRGYYDGIAVHPYYDPTLSGLKAFRAYEVSQGDDSPLWVTEIGWASNAYGVQGQADNISSALDQLSALPYVSEVEVYDMRDGGTDPTDGEDHFGLVDTGLNPKPAWTAFTSTLQALGAPTAQASTTTTTPSTTTTSTTPTGTSALGPTKAPTARASVAWRGLPTFHITLPKKTRRKAKAKPRARRVQPPCTRTRRHHCRRTVTKRARSVPR